MNNVDLSALRMQPTDVPTKRPRGPRLLGWLALGLVFAVAATFLWPLLRPVRSVVTARIEAGAAVEAASAAIAEAAGWIEPDPFPIQVRPLVAGRIEQIPLLEGAPVQKDITVLATLASATLLAAKQRAEATLAEREREVQAAQQRAGLAKAQLEQLAQPRAALADAAAKVAASKASLATALGARDRSRAEQRSADAALAAQRQLESAGGSYAVARARAEAAVAAADAASQAAAREADAAEQELAAAQQALAVAEQVATTPVDLRGALAVAEAELQRAQAQRDSARVELQIAQREVEWLEVRAPCDGVVMKVSAAPGAFVGPDGDAIVSLYDPRKLRARIDVPLGAVGAIREGQSVELRSEVLGTTAVLGRVQRIQRESDLLKNTLQVKVEVLDPPPLLRPETLCRARFLAEPGREPDAARTAPNMTFRVPKAAVQGGRVFVLDPVSRSARGIAVEVAQEDGDAVLVRGELSVTQRAIVEPVREGERVREVTR